MSSTLWWILVGSIPLALLIMVIAFITLRLRINKVKKEYSLHSKDVDNEAIKREDHGHLLWELKEKTANPLGDLQMEFAINTALRNKYERLYIKGFNEGYEEETLVKKTKLKKTEATFDFALLNFSNTIVNEIDDIMKRAEPKSIIMIANAGKSKGVKDLLSYLKLTGIRNEYQKVEQGIILIAK